MWRFLEEPPDRLFRGEGRGGGQHQQPVPFRSQSLGKAARLLTCGPASNSLGGVLAMDGRGLAAKFLSSVPGHAK